MAKTSSPKLDTASLLKSVKRVVRPFQAHHTIIMFLLLMGVIIYTVQLVGVVLQPVDDSEYRAEVEAKSITTNFDKQTIEKVDNLKQRDSSGPIELPAGRRNPFVD